jgi:hypothetical protein
MKVPLCGGGRYLNTLIDMLLVLKGRSAAPNVEYFFASGGDTPTIVRLVSL